MDTSDVVVMIPAVMTVVMNTGKMSTSLKHDLHMKSSKLFKVETSFRSDVIYELL